MQTAQLEGTTEAVISGSKDRNIKGRKYNGHPHLKLKRVKQSPRQKIRQLLRGFAPLNETGPPFTASSIRKD